MDGLAVVFREKFGGYPAGARVVFDSDSELAQGLLERGIAELAPPIARPEAERLPDAGRIVLCADKIFTSPAIYPGDVFGATAERAAKLIESKAAHLATEDDIRAFYDPRRGL